MMRFYLLALCAVVLSPGQGEAATTTTTRASMNLAQKAQALGLTSLVQKLTEAGLADSVSNIAAGTVFGPTNDAFAALPQSIQDALAANMTMLQQVLKYHVIAARVTSDQLTNEQLAPTLDGRDIRINIYGSGAQQKITASGSEVTAADEEADNGVIHVVNKVMLPPNGNLVEFAVANPDFSTLVTAVTTANLQGALSGPGPFTLFAPSNAAFAKIPADDLNALLQDIPRLTKVLQYHVVSGTYYSLSLSDGQKVPTLEGNSLTVSISAGVVKIDQSTVTAVDTNVVNGVIHVIDTVLFPPADLSSSTTATTTTTRASMNLAQKAQALGLTSLVQKLTEAGLADSVSNIAAGTVFGPTNDAFAALPQSIQDALAANITMLQQVLKYHVIAARVTSDQLTNEQLAPTLDGRDIRINIYGSGAQQKITASGSEVTAADEEADNGVIHVVNKVMLPPNGNLVEFAVANPDFSTLVTAVTTANLQGALSGPGPFTLFAPNNAAFAKIPADDLNALLQDIPRLTKVLQYHVVSGTSYSISLSDGQKIPTLEGNELTVSISEGTVKIDQSTVTAVDTNVVNGVIHVIDTVLFPPNPAPTPSTTTDPTGGANSVVINTSLLTFILPLIRYLY